MEFAYNELLEFFSKYLLYYRELLTFENKKFALVLEDNITMLEKSLEEEQALMMRGESLEKKRMKIQMEMGIGDKTFEEMIAVAPEIHKLRLSSVHQELSALVFEIKKINLLGNELVRDKLETIAQITNKHKGPSNYDKTGATNTYGPDVRRPDSKTS